jgi:hypothetical protein
MIFDKLDPLAFAVALGIGMMINYVIAPRPKRVVKFPTPGNSGKVVYKDALRGCYVYKSEKVTWSKEAMNIPNGAEEFTRLDSDTSGLFFTRNGSHGRIGF